MYSTMTTRLALASPTTRKKWLPGIILMALIAVLTLWGSTASAFPEYSGWTTNGDSTTGNCATCHGPFRAGRYISMTADDPAAWGANMMAGHDGRYGLTCSDCHYSAMGDRNPVFLGKSDSGLHCTSCHGRLEDGPYVDGGPVPLGAMAGAGLRQNHWNVNTSVNPNTGLPFPNGWTTRMCEQCHLDSNPANFTPVGEHVPSQAFALMNFDPCDEHGTIGADPAFGVSGLDNDGDLCREGADPDCPNGGTGTSRSCVGANCGDGITQPFEDCDDSNTISGDGCSAICQFENVCGNGILELGEACDDGNTANGDGCNEWCTSNETCGNSIIDAVVGEMCDDGNTMNNDGCSDMCLLEVCGDGIIQTNEECDDGNTSNLDSCSSICLAIVCGNNRVDPGEACDDGNTTSGDGCNATCSSTEVCGNNIVDPGEECDGGVCNADCTLPVCGNSVVEPGEACDDGNTVDGDGCDNNCTLSVPVICGDGIVGLGETCDDGNAVSGDGCDATCNIESDGTQTCTGKKRNPICVDNVCGDGTINQSYEQCDDGNTLSGDGCSPTCQDEVCGNGNIDPGESCDDGNTVDTDGCDSLCQIVPVCGNGIRETGERCDDGNLIDGDGCSSTCWNDIPIAVAGPDQTVFEGTVVTLDGTGSYDPDGIIVAYEWLVGSSSILLDDPTSPTPSFIAPEVTDTLRVRTYLYVIDNGGLWSSRSIPPVNITVLNNACGDNRVGPGEQCDDGNTTGGDGCTADCQFEGGICGDGVIHPGEACDDGSLNGIPTSCASSYCDTNCQVIAASLCGDGIVCDAVGEQCDDGNVASGDGCSPTCETEICGNGTLDPGETCDDGNTINGDGCNSACQIEESICGNGIIEAGEVCDGIIYCVTEPCYQCLSDCTGFEGCGDSILQTGEECDDGNTVRGDGCENNCTVTPPYCGDGTINQTSEQCDDGNIQNNDGCDIQCQIETEYCGNGIREKNTGEECDDGNATSGDGCSSTCQKEK